MMEIPEEIRQQIRDEWERSGILPYTELRKRYPHWKEEIDEAVIDFVTEEMEEWPEGDLDFEYVMGQLAENACFGEPPPTWSRRRAEVDLSRFRGKR